MSLLHHFLSILSRPVSLESTRLRQNPAWKEPWELTHAELLRYEVPTSRTDGSREPGSVPTMLAEGMSTLADYRGSSQTVREWLYHWSPTPEYRSTELLPLVMSGAPMTIYRATSQERVIFPGAYVTLSRKYADDHGRRVFGRGHYHLLRGEATAEELVVVNPNEFWYAPRDLRNWHREQVAQALRRKLPVRPEVLADFPGLELSRRSIRRNPLLARPPEASHGARRGSVYDIDLGVRGMQRFRYLMGRDPRPEDYEGIHATGNTALAAFYALTTTDRRGSGFGPDDSYPVVLELDVTGLEEHPDVDAMMEGAEFFDDHLRRELDREWDQDRALWHLAEAYDPEETDWDLDAWGRMGSITPNPIRAVMDYANDDDDEARRVLQAFVDTGEIEPGVVSHLVDQRRFLMDIDERRLIAVLAVQPIWREVIELDNDDEEEAERIEEAGWMIVDASDFPGGIEPTLATVWQNPLLEGQEGRRVQYHGTSSDLAMQAFPDLPWPAQAPFPVR